MKRIILVLLISLATSFAYAQSRKVVVDSRGAVVGRYVATRGNNYVVEVQDDFTVPVSGHRVVTYSAEAGQGVVYRNQSRTGNINVRNKPSLNGAVIAKIADSRGYVPATYPCLGKTNGWYKIRINGKVGYVREDMAEWDAIDTF